MPWDLIYKVPFLADKPKFTEYLDCLPDEFFDLYNLFITIQNIF